MQGSNILSRTITEKILGCFFPMFHGGAVLTVETKRKYPSEALWSRFSYGEITYEEFEQSARSGGVSETVLLALLSVHHGNGPPTSREEYETAVRDPFADVWIGKDIVQVTRWYDLESKPVHPKDAKTKAAFGDARMFAATEDHKEVGSATCRGPFFDEFCKLMYSRRHVQLSADGSKAKEG
jgi:hypothetical protein